MKRSITHFRCFWALCVFAGLALLGCTEVLDLDGAVRTDASRDGNAHDAQLADGRAMDAGCPAVPCAAGQLCVEGQCVRDFGPCPMDMHCPEDQRCVEGRCVPWQSNGFDRMCVRDVRPGVFAPTVQCAFDTAPAGDPFPQHQHVVPTPMVADLKVYGIPDGPPRPSIVAVFSVLENNQGGGIIRILDGRTCQLQATIGTPRVVSYGPVAVADLDNDGTPEIVALLDPIGMVAFRYDRAGAGAWRVFWETRGPAEMADLNGSATGPSIVDLDDDGNPEVLRGAYVYNGQTGAFKGGRTLGALTTAYANGTRGHFGVFPVVLDLDGDHNVEFIHGAGRYNWSRAMNDWVAPPWFSTAMCAGGCADGHVAVADMGPYASRHAPGAGAPEVVVVSVGTVRIDTMDGDTVFGPITHPGTVGGPPTIADFDGDGQREIAVAGGDAIAVFDPDCLPMANRPNGQCMSNRPTRDGILWTSPAQDLSSAFTGSTSFDFEADGRVELIYSDECFLRVYDGRTGSVLASMSHSSCTSYEHPVVADVDGDYRAEIVLPSNFICGPENVGVACPGVGPRNEDIQHAGLRCLTAEDCASGRCIEGYCRCAMDAECCHAGVRNCGYVCTEAPAGTPGMGNTCRAARPQGRRGITVFSDTADRWVGTRMLWNQFSYNVTNINDDLRVPRTSMVRANWSDPMLNNFRTNVQGGASSMGAPDLTATGHTGPCNAMNGLTLFATVCNRGSAIVPDGVSVTFTAMPMGGMPSNICTAHTMSRIDGGRCVEVECHWPLAPMAPVDVQVSVDDDRLVLECREDNNSAVIRRVQCPMPG